MKNKKLAILNKKGFTLIEIIVVVVILAVLFAVAVPSVLSYINEADDAKYYAKGRSILNAAQVEAAMLKATGTLSSAELLNNNDKIITNSQVENAKFITITLSNDNNNIEYFEVQINDKILAYDGINSTFKIIGEGQGSGPGTDTELTFEQYAKRISEVFEGKSDTINKLLKLSAPSTSFDSSDPAVQEQLSTFLAELGLDSDKYSIRIYADNVYTNNKTINISENVESKDVGSPLTVIQYQFGNSFNNPPISARKTEQAQVSLSSGNYKYINVGNAHELSWENISLD